MESSSASRKRVRTAGDVTAHVENKHSLAPSTNDEQRQRAGVDAATKIAELQARLQATDAGHRVEIDDLKAANERANSELSVTREKHKLETDPLKSKNEGLVSALQWA